MYKTILSLALFSIAFATPVTKRDLQTIQTNLGNVNTALQSLDTQIKNINSPQSAAPVLDASNKVNTAITTATQQIQGTDPISLTDAISLQDSGSMLSTTAMTTVMDLIAKKDLINAAGQGPTVLMQLQQQKQSSDALAMAVTSKVPAAVQNVAMQQTMQIGNSLNMGIQAFGGQ